MRQLVRLQEARDFCASDLLAGTNKALPEGLAEGLLLSDSPGAAAVLAMLRVSFLLWWAKPQTLQSMVHDPLAACSALGQRPEQCRTSPACVCSAGGGAGHQRCRVGTPHAGSQLIPYSTLPDRLHIRYPV